MSAKERRDPLKGPSGRGYGQLLAGDLKEKRPKQVHRRKLVEPRMRIEARPSLNELSDHRIHFAEVVPGAPKPRRSPLASDRMALPIGTFEHYLRGDIGDPAVAALEGHLRGGH